jgi:hypothetical protein
MLALMQTDYQASESVIFISLKPAASFNCFPPTTFHNIHLQQYHVP